MNSPKKVFFISDLHLNHSNIINFCSRPFKSVEEMNSIIIDNINSIVKKNDILWVLGDFGFGTKDQISSLTEKLICSHKYLVLGNHDGKSTRWYMENGWEWATRFPVIYMDFIILSHTQQFLQPTSAFFGVFGHVHNSLPHRPGPQYMNVSCEVIDYKPVSLAYILNEIKKEGGHIQ